MFRTFQSNPALGGFGNESSSSSELIDDTSTPDAFCQIIKELVDNAIDACSVTGGSDRSLTTKSSTKRNKTTTKTQTKGNHTAHAKRVRVVIEEFNGGQSTQQDDDNESANHKEILRVTVSDNGCGMQNIQDCVGAFHTSKAHNSSVAESSKSKNGAKRKGKPNASSKAADKEAESQTAGRYGIGLTLCLLHAQRLVSNSCASIQSAVGTDKEWTAVTAVVDAASDAVRCFPRKSVPKTHAGESGTSISVLVPGGSSAILAWPRLAEYFARFKLSMGMTCGVEVLAPTLSRVPLRVQPLSLREQGVGTENSNKRASVSRAAREVDLCNVENPEGSDFDSDDEDARSARMPSKERIAICEATSRFLGRPVNVENVAHICVPIRSKGKAAGNKKSKNAASTGPMLEVDVIVHGPYDDDDDIPDSDSLQDHSSDEESDAETTFEKHDDHDTSSSASMVLVRMVNKIPLLDSSEAAACGLVLGLSSKKRMWNSFGLEVSTNHDPAKVDKLPTFDVRDSEQVAPFIKKGAHQLFEDRADVSQENAEDSRSATGAKRKKQVDSRGLLPASVRLGNILVIAQLHAEPTMLPLPTLSKGRLPIDNKAIDDALELGMTRCLRQLQTTNPNLLLTASELRVAERDSRYVPAVAEALALILANAVSNPAPVEQILEWDTATDGSMSSKSSSDAKVLGTLIEERLRLVLAKPRKSSRKKPKRGEKSAKRRANDASDHESLDEATQPEHSDTEETEEMADLAASAVETLSKKPKAVSVSDTPVESDYDDWL